MADRFVHDDAPYLLGALSATERDAFEEHLRTCPGCTERVAQLTGVADALAAVPADEAAALLAPEIDDAAVPTVLPDLVRSVRRRRRRQAVLIAASAAVAASAATVLLVLGLGDSGGSTTPPAGGRPMVALVATPVHATARLTSRPWGTEVTVSCRYDAGAGAGAPYAMVVTDTDGTVYPLGSWALAPGQSLTFASGVALPAGRITAVEITVPGGAAILRLGT